MYDRAVARKDVETVRTLLAPEMLLYEHSVRNDGAKDAFENHLKPEILEGDGLQLSFSDLRITASSELALVTRQYRVQGSFQGKAINSTGNETQVWKKADGQWRIIHIHVIGTVTKITDKAITVEVAAETQKTTVTVNIAPATKFEKSCAGATIKDLRAGDRVVIHAGKKGNQLEARVAKIGTVMNGAHQD